MRSIYQLSLVFSDIAGLSPMKLDNEDRRHEDTFG